MKPEDPPCRTCGCYGCWCVKPHESHQDLVLTLDANCILHVSPNSTILLIPTAFMAFATEESLWTESLKEVIYQGHPGWEVCIGYSPAKALHRLRQLRVIPW